MEVEVFRQFKPALVDAIRDSIPGVSLQCHSRGLIKHTYDRIQHENKTDKEKATMLVDAIETTIATDYNHYYTFTDILEKELPSGAKKPLNDMADKLKSMPSRTCTDVGNTAENTVIVVPRYPSDLKTVYNRSEQSSLKGNKSDSTESYSHSVSKASGFSQGGRSDSSVSKPDSVSEQTRCTPSEETTLHHKTDSTMKSLSERKCLEVPTMANQLFNMADVIRNLGNDALQKEAVETSRIKLIERLTKERDKLLSEKNIVEKGKNETEEELRATKTKLTEMERENRELLENAGELSTCKADKEQLTAKVKEMEKINTKLIAEIETKKKEIECLESKIHQLQKTDIDMNVVQDICQQLLCDLRQKEKQLVAKEAEVQISKAEVKAKDEELNKKSKERDYYCRLFYLLLFVLVAVLVAAVYSVTYRGSHCMFLAFTHVIDLFHNYTCTYN